MSYFANSMEDSSANLANAISSKITDEVTMSVNIERPYTSSLIELLLTDMLANMPNDTARIFFLKKRIEQFESGVTLSEAEKDYYSLLKQALLNLSNQQIKETT